MVNWSRVNAGSEGVFSVTKPITMRNGIGTNERGTGTGTHHYLEELKLFVGEWRRRQKRCKTLRKRERKSDEEQHGVSLFDFFYRS
jgi:hypothetical protein